MVIVGSGMGPEWVLLSMLIAVALWLGLDACRESRRLHARLSRPDARRPDETGAPTRGDWAYWPMTTSTSDDVHIGPRL
ncbi:MAG: hypothetical protein J2P19_12895 [Pseudonocardia sp.]|nr:hypothetical protein [Pseudonocardia sp.]